MNTIIKHLAVMDFVMIIIASHHHLLLLRMMWWVKILRVRTANTWKCGLSLIGGEYSDDVRALDSIVCACTWWCIQISLAYDHSLLQTLSGLVVMHVSYIIRYLRIVSDNNNASCRTVCVMHMKWLMCVHCQSLPLCIVNATSFYVTTENLNGIQVYLLYRTY